MEFVKLKLKEEFKIESLVSLHYFEFARDYIFRGERHNFWELLYIDKGEAEVTADTNGYKLTQGDMIFHKPNEFHSVWANKKTAPNIIVISFICNSEAMSSFEGKIYSVGDFEKNTLGNIIKEGFKAFRPPFNDPLKNTLIRKNEASFASEQMIQIYLQILLINLVRKNMQLKMGERLSTAARERTEEDIIDRLESYLMENMDCNLNLHDICSYMKMSRTHLVTLSKKKREMGVIELYKKLKIEKAKTYIREECLNLTEISVKLGYNSIHSFSRHFRKVTDMSPSEYARSVKSFI
ncbi:MAG: helix-turn-helix domain-containing protein [Ruminiclostridium sp.]|nr:helix-turn-helix domain-containing protein [Ruminiclostridium sp.]